MRKRVLIQCSTQVNKNAVRRETIDGVEHIIISSYTLPDNIVMNGGLYPAEEIDKSFKTLERTLAPVEHPKDSSGNYISANDPTAIHNYYAGAFNQNVRKDGGRIAVDKVINVMEALKTDRGRRLLDRVDELETSDNPRPIHTSTGVYMDEVVLDSPRTNDAGQEYTWIGTNMFFDHDAILLDSVGAAQPSQGVGMAVNREGEKVDVRSFELNSTKANQEDDETLSYEELRERLLTALNKPPLKADWVVDIIGNEAIYVLDDNYFKVPFVVGNGTITITGLPVPVDRNTSFVPKQNQRKGDAMREVLLKALSDAGVTVNADISDTDLLAEYNKLQANQQSEESSGAGDQTVVTNALKAMQETLDGLVGKVNKQEQDELDRLAGIVGNSDKYPGLDVDGAKKLGVETLKSMAANCVSSYGLPLDTVNVQGAGGANEPYEMPK